MACESLVPWFGAGAARWLAARPVPVYCLPSEMLSLQDKMNSHVFVSPAYFIRWLFEQPRGNDVEPWAVLVTTWRHAKPCAGAITAARTGHVVGLRADGQRPKLRKAGIGPLKSVMAAVVLVVEDAAQAKKAWRWAESEGWATMQVPVTVHVMAGHPPGLPLPAQLMPSFDALPQWCQALAQHHPRVISLQQAVTPPHLAWIEKNAYLEKASKTEKELDNEPRWVRLRQDWEMQELHQASLFDCTGSKTTFTQEMAELVLAATCQNQKLMTPLTMHRLHL